MPEYPRLVTMPIQTFYFWLLYAGVPYHPVYTTECKYMHIAVRPEMMPLTESVHTVKTME